MARKLKKSGLAIGSFSNVCVGASLFGASAAVGFMPPPGLTLATFGVNALLGVLSDQRRIDAERILKVFRADLARNWESWVPRSAAGDPARLDYALECFNAVMPDILLTPAEVTAARLDPQRLADLMLAKAAEIMPDPYGRTAPGDLDAALARKFLHDLTCRAYAHLVAMPEYTASIGSALWTDLFSQMDRVEAGLAQGFADTQARLKVLEGMLVGQGTRAPARTAAGAPGLSEAALVALAQRISAGVVEPAQALRELERAVEIAISVQDAPRDDPALAAAATLSAEGDYDSAAARLDEALAREQQAHAARQIALLQAAIQQDLLRRAPAAAATRLARIEDIRTGGAAGMAELGAVWMDWFLSGRDRGTLIDLAVAEELARIMLARAEGRQERGQALNYLGVIQHTRGERSADPRGLLAATASFENALMEWDRDEMPESWAKAQMNLANSQHALAQRDLGNDRIGRALSAYRAALEVRNRHDLPADWAMTQMNLATALRTQAEIDADPEAARASIAALEEALEIRKKGENPLQWAVTRLNLAMSRHCLGALTEDADQLRQAIAEMEALGADWQDETTRFYRTTAELHRAMALNELGRLDGSGPCYRAALDALDRILADGSEEDDGIDRLMARGQKAIAQIALDGAGGAESRAERDLAEVCFALSEAGHRRGAARLRDARARTRAVPVTALPVSGPA